MRTEGKGEVGCYYIMGIEFQSCKIKRVLEIGCITLGCTYYWTAHFNMVKRVPRPIPMCICVLEWGTGGSSPHTNKQFSDTSKVSENSTVYQELASDSTCSSVLQHTHTHTHTTTHNTLPMLATSPGYLCSWLATDWRFQWPSLTQNVTCTFDLLTINQSLPQSPFLSLINLLKWFTELREIYHLLVYYKRI